MWLLIQRENDLSPFVAVLKYCNTLIKSSPEPLLLQGEETQLFQVLLSGQVIQASNHSYSSIFKHHSSNFICHIKDDVVFGLPNGKTFSLEKV